LSQNGHRKQNASLIEIVSTGIHPWTLKEATVVKIQAMDRVFIGFYWCKND